MRHHGLRAPAGWHEHAAAGSFHVGAFNGLPRHHFDMIEYVRHLSHHYFNHHLMA